MNRARTPAPIRLHPSRIVALPLVPLLALPASARAQGEAASLSSGLVQMAVGLAVVLAVLFAALYLLKRLAAPRGPGSGLLRVIAAVAVGPRERVVVVEAGEQWLVLGVAPGRVASLTRLPRQDMPAAPPAADFAGWLRQTLERRNAR